MPRNTWSGGWRRIDVATIAREMARSIVDMIMQQTTSAKARFSPR